MHAIIETGGKQFRVAANDTIRVPSLGGEPGEMVTFDRILYARDGKSVLVGAPVVEGATVTAEIVKHGRGKKITVFKTKRRKRYSRKQGHRQGFTELRVTGLAFGRRKVAAPDSEAAAEADESTQYVCPECGKEYGSERGLKQHMSLTHKE
ncbi:MAG: 50S ribosomal protein L21 [Gemmatimonadota bacterium]